LTIDKLYAAETIHKQAAWREGKNRGPRTGKVFWQRRSKEMTRWTGFGYRQADSREQFPPGTAKYRMALVTPETDYRAEKVRRNHRSRPTAQHSYSAPRRGGTALDLSVPSPLSPSEKKKQRTPGQCSVRPALACSTIHSRAAELRPGTSCIPGWHRRRSPQLTPYLNTIEHG